MTGLKEKGNNMDTKQIPWSDVLGYGIPMLIVIIGAVWAVLSEMSIGEAILIVIVVVACSVLTTIGIVKRW